MTAKLTMVFLGVCTLLTCSRLFAQSASQSHDQRIELTQEGRAWVEQSLRSLSLEEKVGQMLQVRYFGDYESFNSASYKSLRDELQKYSIGSVILGLHFDASGPSRSSPLAQAAVANQLQRDSKLPLLIAADLERGMASRLTDVPAFPWPMAFGAIGDPDEVERFAAVTAREARAVGIHWALAPVADVNSNPANPIINTRSFGEDPEAVGTLVAAFIRGAHKNGLLVSAKHFPGHGDTTIDSHHGVPVISGSLERLQRVEFQPFKQAIAAQADSIVLAHARVPALEPDSKKITTVSSAVVTGVLRGQLGFRGVVVTDAMEMSGVTTLYGNTAAVEAIKAGADVIALPGNLKVVYRAIVDAVRRGEISESRIDESVRKILQMKASAGLHKLRFVDLDQVVKLVSRPEDLNFAQHVAEQAVTLVRNNGKTLPLRKNSVRLQGSSLSGSEIRHEIVAILITESPASSSGRELEKALHSRCPDAAVFFVDQEGATKLSPQILKRVNEAREVVVAAYAYHTAAKQTAVGGRLVTVFGLAGPTGELLHQVLGVAAEKTVVIAFGSPYIIENFPEIQTYICTYATAVTSETAAVKAIFGEIQGSGRLPVGLHAVAVRGFSLPWPTTR